MHFFTKLLASPRAIPLPVIKSLGVFQSFIPPYQMTKNFDMSKLQALILQMTKMKFC